MSSTDDQVIEGIDRSRIDVREVPINLLPVIFNKVKIHVVERIAQYLILDKNRSMISPLDRYFWRSLFGLKVGVLPSAANKGRIAGSKRYNKRMYWIRMWSFYSDYFDNSLLCISVRYGHLPIVRKYLQPDSDISDLIYESCTQGQGEVLKFLLQFNGKVPISALTNRICRNGTYEIILDYYVKTRIKEKEVDAAWKEYIRQGELQFLYRLHQYIPKYPPVVDKLKYMLSSFRWRVSDDLPSIYDPTDPYPLILSLLTEYETSFLSIDGNTLPHRGSPFVGTHYRLDDTLSHRSVDEIVLIVELLLKHGVNIDLGSVIVAPNKIIRNIELDDFGRKMSSRYGNYYFDEDKVVTIYKIVMKYRSVIPELQNLKRNNEVDTMMAVLPLIDRPREELLKEIIGEKYELYSFMFIPGGRTASGVQ